MAEVKPPGVYEFAYRVHHGSSFANPDEEDWLMAVLAILSAATLSLAAPTPPAACGPAPLLQTQSTTPLRPRKLGDLPDGYLTRAVLVKVGPCAMRVVKEPAGLNRFGVWRYEPDGLWAPKPQPASGADGR